MFCFGLFFFFFFVFIGLFVLFAFFGAKGEGGGWSKENIFLTKIAHLKLSFNPQFKYILVLFLPQRNSIETVSVRQILNANSSVC